MISIFTLVNVIFLVLLIIAIFLKIFSVFEKPKSYVLDIIINFLSIALLMFSAKTVSSNPLAAENMAMASIVLFIFGNMLGILKAILNIIDPSLESKK